MVISNEWKKLQVASYLAHQILLYTLENELKTAILTQKLDEKGSFLGLNIIKVLYREHK